MRLFCVLQGTSLVKCQNEEEALRVVEDWLSEGFQRDEIEIFPWTSPFAWDYTSTVEAKFVK